MISTNAGTLKIAPVGLPSMNTGFDSDAGRWKPKTFSSRSLKYAENPTATAMFETAYSRIRSQPMIQAKISPRVA